MLGGGWAPSSMRYLGGLVSWAPRLEWHSQRSLASVQRGYEEDWLGGTFSQAVFVGNGLMAILSGFLAHTLVEGLSLGPVAPFDAAHAVLLLGGVVVLTTWTENFGDESRDDNTSLARQITAALQAIRRGEPPALYGPPTPEHDELCYCCTSACPSPWPYEWSPLLVENECRACQVQTPVQHQSAWLYMSCDSSCDLFRD